MEVINLLLWISRIGLAVIFLTFSFVKFKSHPSSIKVFSKLNMEPWGRYLIAILEILVVALLLFPSMVKVGGILALFVVVPAIFAHLIKLKIKIDHDRGMHFIMALVVLALSLFILINY